MGVGTQPLPQILLEYSCCKKVTPNHAKAHKHHKTARSSIPGARMREESVSPSKPMMYDKKGTRLRFLIVHRKFFQRTGNTSAGCICPGLSSM